MEKITYETPCNKEDIEGIYKALSAVLIGMGRPSDELGYLSTLYTEAILYQQAKQLLKITEFRD